MFGKQFYPTPKNIIKKMLKPYREKENYNLERKYILEPSAGKGDILDFIKKEYSSNGEYSTPKMYALEQDINLQIILKEKDYTILGADFLTYNGDILFDIIIMNPPFKDGDKHLLKAWEIIYEGDIICLLNSETINNPYTETRKLLVKIIEKNGTIKDLGSCFDTAERKTNINISLIRLTKIAKEKIFEFKFEQRGKEKSFGDLNEETIKNDEIAVQDIIGNTVIQYEQLKKAYIEYLKGCEAINFYASGLLGQYTNVFDIAKESIDLNNKKISFNTFTNKIKSHAWADVLSKSGLEKYMTSSVQRDFNKFTQEQGQMDFTKENIYAIIYMIVENSSKILEQTIVDAFDVMTQHYYTNRNYVEGWKTNDSWKVNRRIILPHWIKYGDYCSTENLKKYGDKFNTCYDKNYSDIDKALCYITSDNYTHILTIKCALENKFNELKRICTGDKFNNNCESTFFNIKFYKKGTIHIEFKDKKLWEEFNIRATHQKNWLPPIEYDEWKRKRNGETIPDDDRMIEEVTSYDKNNLQQALFE